jgi:hypothetical protein
MTNHQQTQFKRILGFLLFVFGSTFSGYTFSTTCTEADQNYVEMMSSKGATANGAHMFGLKIQNIIKKRDIVALMQLVDGELDNGPRRSAVIGKKFDEVFDRDWVDAILSKVPECTPVGWRGYMLGNGDLWYDFTNTGWKITVLNGAKELEPQPTSYVWNFDDKIIHPKCFAWPWNSRDNFEELAELFGINDIDKFTLVPGEYIGREVTSYDSVKPSWCVGEPDCEDVFLVTTIQSCVPEKYKNESENAGVSVSESSSFGTVRFYYKVLKNVSVDVCSKLAPNINAECVESNLVDVGQYINASNPWSGAVGIYGVFNLPNKGHSIVPLKFFYSENEALNYLSGKENE